METITRQQRRYEERKKKKEENRKPLPKIVLNRYKGFIRSTDGFLSKRSNQRLSSQFKEKNRGLIHDVNIKDIKKIVVHRYDNGYMDDRACLVFKKPISRPDGVEDEIDLSGFHKEGKIKGLPDLYRISNTGFCNTRGFNPIKPKQQFHPFVVFEKNGKDMMLPMDSWYLFVWNDKGDLVHRDETFNTLLDKDFHNRIQRQINPLGHLNRLGLTDSMGNLDEDGVIKTFETLIEVNDEGNIENIEEGRELVQLMTSSKD